MSNLSDLKAAYVAAAASISETTDRLECLSDIDAWYTCRLAIDAISAGNLESYSINGRSFTRRSLPEVQLQERQLYQRIKAALYGAGIAYVDVRDPIDSGVRQ